MYTIHSNNQAAPMSVLPTECLLFISLLTLALECFLSTNLSWVSLSMGGQFSLKLGVCDRIVYQFFFSFSSLLWQFSLTPALHRPAKGWEPAAAFVVNARAPGFFFSLLLSVCTRCLTCHEREASFIKFNPTHGWKYTINRPTALCLKIKWLNR